MLSLSLSLSHYYLSMSKYISLSSLCIFSESLCTRSRDRCKADSTLKTSRAVPHPITNRALCRFSFGVRKRSGNFDTVWPSANMLMMMFRALEMKCPWHSITTRFWEAL
jgi:hypothetical protein